MKVAAIVSSRALIYREWRNTEREKENKNLDKAVSIEIN